MRVRTYAASIFAMVACAGIKIANADEEEEPDIDEGLVGLADESVSVEVQPHAAAELEEEEPDIEDDEPIISPSLDRPAEIAASIDMEDEEEPDAPLGNDDVAADQHPVAETSWMECEKIDQSNFSDEDSFDGLFHFYQHDSRLDPNQLVKVVFKIISTIKMEKVKKLSLDYTPHLKNEVGPYPVRTTVTTLGQGGQLHEKCYEITIMILDTDECTHTERSEWRHNCHESAQCVNTEGSYYCGCPEGDFAVPGSGGGKCGSEASSVECCGQDESCRADFQCHRNNCAFNSCDPNAVCAPGKEPNTYECACKDGFRDVSEGGRAGFACAAVDHCASGGCPASCACESIVNATHDGYICPPKPGDIAYYPSSLDEWNVVPTADSRRLDGEHLCLSQDSAPLLVPEGPHPMLLKQGSKYIEYGVTIVDEDTGDLKRRFITDYSKASGVEPGGIVRTCGTSHVTYTINTPWIIGRPTVSTTREVTVVDVDECTYVGEDESFKHACVGLATCKNTGCADGDNQGYECVCLNEGYEPDGHNGCRDKRAPTIMCSPEHPDCAEVVMWAVKAEGALLDDGAVEDQSVFFENAADDAWIESSIAKLPPPKLLAVEHVPRQEEHPELGYMDIAIDMTTSITPGILKKLDTNEDAQHAHWVQAYHVEDEAGNSATLEVNIKVVVVTSETLKPLLPHMTPQSLAATVAAKKASSAASQSASSEAPLPACVPVASSGPSLASSSWARFQTYLLCLIVLYCAFLTLRTALQIVTALQCLLVPGSMATNRKRFEQGMDLLLWVQSKGALSKADRMRLADVKWLELASFNQN